MLVFAPFLSVSYKKFKFNLKVNSPLFCPKLKSKSRNKRDFEIQKPWKVFKADSNTWNLFFFKIKRFTSELC